MNKFFEKMLMLLMWVIDFKKLWLLLFVSFGFVVVDFKKYIEIKGREEVDKVLMEVVRVVIVVYLNFGYLYSLNEIFKSFEVLL